MSLDLEIQGGGVEAEVAFAGASLGFAKGIDSPESKCRSKIPRRFAHRNKC